MKPTSAVHDDASLPTSPSNDQADSMVGYFACLEALDSLEFHILDRIDPAHASRELVAIRDQAERLHGEIAAVAQSAIHNLVRDIRAGQVARPALKNLFNRWANSISDEQVGDAPDYDLFDSFLSHFFQIDAEPSETRARTEEMVYLQPTPGRVILDMINGLPFTESDRLYDLGSGLGRVALLAALLTDASAVGVEYEPTYCHYARRSAHKLGITNVEFQNIDARDADLSDGTIFFMYTPFTGSILRDVLDKLRDLSQARAITVCSYGPNSAIIEQERWLVPVRPSQGNTARLAILNSAVPV